jgi:hypothetical protein
LGLEARRALSAPEVARRGGEALRRLAALPFFSRAKFVGLYAGQADEVPAQQLAQSLGARAVFARFEKGSRVALAPCSPASRRAVVCCRFIRSGSPR